MGVSRFIPARSLTARLLFLTVLFVLAAEIVVMIPSVAKHRMDWFHARMEAAYLVSVALEGEDMITRDEARMLFETAAIRGVSVQRDDKRILIFAPETDPHGEPGIHRVDLSNRNPMTLIVNAWATMFSSGEALIQVSGVPGDTAGESFDIIVSQAALRRDLHLYARNILVLSLVISTLTAALLFYALNALIVRPVQRLTSDMSAFEADPDRAALIHRPSGRIDEIGAAERGLAAMQRRLHDLLRERRRLAALGAGISKISHDLRNILASAQLMSDRLAKSDDPAMRKLSPRLISALDRAIVLSRDTLAFGRMEASLLDKSEFDLSELASEVLDDTAALHVSGENAIAEGFAVTADRTHLYRALFNLAKNAAEAMDREDGEPGSLRFRAERSDEGVHIWIEDTGPGLPAHAREDLFEPFKGSQKPGGSGLGIAISAEVVRAHGGDIILERSDEKGTTFLVKLPE